MQMGEMTDARDMLAFKARGMDARDKLNKIRNLKQGKLDEKTTQNGGITITTTTKGKVRDALLNDISGHQRDGSSKRCW